MQSSNLLASAVPNHRVATHAVHRLCLTAAMFGTGSGPNISGQFVMAEDTVPIEYFGVDRTNLDRLVKVLEREGSRVMEAVERLRKPFPEELMRNMAVVACRHRVVTGSLPPLELLSHDVAVYAGLR